MGLVITSTATQSGSGSAIEQSAAAARTALTAIDSNFHDVDALVNVGVYRDSNLCEPSIAALIQHEAELSLEYARGKRACVSFDLMNGACGVLNGIGALSALLADPETQRGVLVSGDAHPSTKLDADFPFLPVGCALVLERGADDEGFGRVHMAAGTGTVVAQGFGVYQGGPPSGRNGIEIEQTITEGELVDYASSAARAALDEAGLTPADVVLICGKPTDGYAKALGAELGIEEVVTDDFDGDAHTSALTTAFERAVATGQATSAKPLLFVAADAGPTAAAVIYRVPQS